MPRPRPTIPLLGSPNFTGSITASFAGRLLQGTLSGKSGVKTYARKPDGTTDYTRPRIGSRTTITETRTAEAQATTTFTVANFPAFTGLKTTPADAGFDASQWNSEAFRRRFFPSDALTVTATLADGTRYEHIQPDFIVRWYTNTSTNDTIFFSLTDWPVTDSSSAIFRNANTASVRWQNQAIRSGSLPAMTMAIAYDYYSDTGRDNVVEYPFDGLLKRMSMRMKDGTETKPVLQVSIMNCDAVPEIGDNVEISGEKGVITEIQSSTPDDAYFKVIVE